MRGPASVLLVPLTVTVTVALALALTLTPPRPPAGAAAADPAPTSGRLGGTRASFEAAHGAAIDDSTWPDVPRATVCVYQTEDYGGIQVVYYENRVARVSTFLQGGETWDRDQADAAIRAFAPTDAAFEAAEIDVYPGDVGTVLGRNGRSEGVGDDIAAGAYQALDAPGSPGDISAHVTATEDGEIVGIGVFLGLIPADDAGAGTPAATPAAAAARVRPA